MSRIISLLSRGSLALLILCVIAIPALAQSDPDPNSTAPVLMSGSEKNRAYAVNADGGSTDGVSQRPDTVFADGSNVTVFVSGSPDMAAEGVESLRVYGEDADGHGFRFPVLNISPTQSRNTFAVTFNLSDEVKYWSAIKQGDILINVTWRGLTTDRLRLAYGSSGGTLKDDETPLSKLYAYTAADERKGRGTGDSDLAMGYRWSGDRLRFLEQAAFGPTPALDQRLRRIGLRTWLAEQFETNYSTPYPNFPLRSTDRGNVTVGCGMFTSGTLERRVCERDHYTMYPMQKFLFSEALYGDAQLRLRVAWALSQIWVVSGNNGDTQQSRWMSEYFKILSDNAFGNYRTLMGQITRNPAMGNYLSMARSTKNNPNENYAREILQLFTIGLYELNQNGTLKLSGGQPIPTYDQTIVNNFTKVFTGFGFCENTSLCPNRTVGAPNYIDPLLLNQNNHDVTAKTLLNYPNAPNVSIAAGQNGNEEIEKALDNIFYHPNVAPFVSKLLIQHLVTSDPTPAYVGRVAAKFNDNGAGVRGDLKTVVRTILLDPEARGDAKTDPKYGKLREPVQLVTNVLKTFNVRAATTNDRSDGVINNLTTPLGQNTFNSPTVFNYYSPDYVIPGTTVLGPEFGIMTTSTSVARANFANTMVFSRINVGENNPAGTSLDFAEMQALAAADATGGRLLDELDYRMMHNTMSAQMRAKILTAFTAITATNTLARTQQAAYLVATSSQYQVQR